MPRIQLPDYTPIKSDFDEADREIDTLAVSTNNLRYVVAENLALKRVLLQATTQIHSLVDRGI